MQTQTHFFITAALGQLGRRRVALPAHMPALLVGSVLPDVPFALLTLLYTAYYRWIASPGQGADILRALAYSAAAYPNISR